MDVKYSMSAAIITEGMCPRITERGVVDGEYKYRMYHAVHPTDKLLAEAKASWDEYQEQWKAGGSVHDYIPYPYTREMIEGYFAEYSAFVGFPVTADGPPKDSPEPNTHSTKEVGALPAWIKDENALGQVEYAVHTEHKSWWSDRCGLSTPMFK